MGNDFHLGYGIPDTFKATPLSQTSVVFNNTYLSYFDFTYAAAIGGDWTFYVYACAEYPHDIDCTFPPIMFSLEVKDPCLEPVESINGVEHVFDEAAITATCGFNPVCSSGSCSSSGGGSGGGIDLPPPPSTPSPRRS